MCRTVYSGLRFFFAKTGKKRPVKNVMVFFLSFKNLTHAFVDCVHKSGSLACICVLPCGSFKRIVSTSVDLLRAFVGGFDSFQSIQMFLKCLFRGRMPNIYLESYI